MKNVLRIIAIAMPLVWGANVAVAEGIVQEVVVTGSENNTREFLGLPPLDDHGTISGREDNAGETFRGDMHQSLEPSMRHRSHVR